MRGETLCFMFYDRTIEYDTRTQIHAMLDASTCLSCFPDGPGREFCGHRDCEWGSFCEKEDIFW